MSVSPVGPKDVVIVGAGIAGLAAAHTLKKAGYRVLLLERSTRVGGLIQSIRDQDYLCEEGPNTFLSSAKPLLNLVNKLGLEPALTQTDDRHNRRYIFKNGRLQEVPTNPLTFLLSPLLSWRGKLRLLWEPFASAPPADRDEAFADFVTRRLGREVLQTIADPMVSGIIAGDARYLSAAAAFPKLTQLERQHKSLFAAMWARRKKMRERTPSRLLSFSKGMSTLTAALESQLKADIRCGVEIIRISQRADHRWEVKFVDNGGTFVQEVPAVLVATPAFSAATLLSGTLPDIITPLSAIPYVPVTALHLGFRKHDAASIPPGFGFLVPRNQKVRLLGSIWSSQIFSNRAPADHTLLTLMYGGAADPEMNELNDNDLLRQASADIAQTMSITTRPAFVNIRRHARAIPQYTIGHQNRIANIQTQLMTKPGLFLTGNYISGYSVSDTIQNATHSATEIAEYLTAHHLT